MTDDITTRICGALYANAPLAELAAEAVDEIRRLRDILSDIAPDPDTAKTRTPVNEENQGDGWTPWAGGRCPAPDGTRVEVRFGDGETYVCLLEPSRLTWSRSGWDHRDIVAYRVLP